MRVLMMLGFAAMWIAVACAAPLTDTMVPLPMGEVTVRQVWEGILETDAQVVAALASTAPFDGPAALPADHASQIPLDMALDAMAEPLGLIWYHDPVGVVVLYFRASKYRVPVLSYRIGRDTVAPVSALYDLFEALPTDEDRRRFIAGEWLQPPGGGDPFSRAAKRFIRQFRPGATNSPEETMVPTPAVELVVYARGLHQAALDARPDEIGLAVGREHVIPPRLNLVSLPSPAAMGPVGLCTIEWRRRVADIPLDAAGPAMRWSLPSEVVTGEGAYATDVDPSVSVAFVTREPEPLEQTVASVSRQDMDTVTSALLGRQEVLVTARGVPEITLLRALATAASCEIRHIDGIRHLGPSDSPPPVETSSSAALVEALMETIARPSLLALEAATGGDVSWADAAWAATKWQDWDSLSDAERSMYVGILPVRDRPTDLASTLGADSLVGTQIGIEVRTAYPVEEWTLSGPSSTYVVLENSSCPVVLMGPFGHR